MEKPTLCNACGCVLGWINENGIAFANRFMQPPSRSEEYEMEVLHGHSTTEGCVRALSARIEQLEHAVLRLGADVAPFKVLK